MKTKKPNWLDHISVGFYVIHLLLKHNFSFKRAFEEVDEIIKDLKEQLERKMKMNKNTGSEQKFLFGQKIEPHKEYEINTISNGKQIVDPRKYFGSILNRFAHENCTKHMTMNNIDLVQYKWPEKDSGKKGKFRIIESKYPREQMHYTQRDVLNIFRDIFDYVTGMNEQFANLELEVFIVRGEPPYNKLIVHDLIKDDTFELLSQEKVIDWLDMK